MKETDAAYIAGLFDADGCATYKKYLCADKRYKDEKGKPKKYWMWNIDLEISMTNQSIIRWVHEVLGVGHVRKKPPHKTSMGKKMQYRWRCSHRDAYRVCCMMFPYAHVKLPKIQKIIDHYDGKVFDGKVVDLESYRKTMALE
tara:strand:- start:13 stop:441 length:429 start_codon:yes stop_codon:yes gene_type:complete